MKSNEPNDYLIGPLAISCSWRVKLRDPSQDTQEKLFFVTAHAMRRFLNAAAGRGRFTITAPQRASD